ncbi:hypothetical protein DSC45_08045 [Streptomyces sp. YIM 130001]|uniref:GDSL-type esterase/lipase family protein n=1 Tax=Streptomyces sp. YIM 130001 TaxID=2259644 RepID=UPI000EDC4C4B|nr:GDSL-type esterase/lipase family protein [Streptomyces sp. YIM 130001]RII19421.1 hypothetical protein DSC45_08045 [Streptomyces sp. YIM 130001]
MTVPRELLRGVGWWDGERMLRADPADLDRLPGDTGERATVPAGVRIAFTARGADAVEIACTASEPLPADTFRPLHHAFTLLCGDRAVAEAPVDPGSSVVRLQLPSADGAFAIHLPEALRPVVRSVRLVPDAATLTPAPRAPRWLVYGDSIAEGWSASRPDLAWPAVAGRALGLDPVNLGYAGAARGALACAEQLASLPGEFITLAFGTNCWSRTPHSAELLRATVRAFLGTVRRRRPGTPVLVVSPVLRPDAESTPNALGATLAELREAVEEAAVSRADDRVQLLPGTGLLRPEHLVDGVHPGDEGHARIAAAVAEVLREG